ncbi:type II inositol 1,4,5-trisphosphate 5-phosphatase-like [Hylobates moloch]|uniref:type II inositol 1,4,5-trisphosphate 5-phosphatase-like n=1 Tax=Hylobates moloch TaxID=81572 RepID=UPI0026747E9E|nr:type II inositol 1,4,5-trisphosphate 5-phosphatase-like [Hylobates moloch]
MDQSVAIQETLAEGEYCPQAVQGVLCEGDSRQSRLLGLVRYRLEHGGQEHALFLYTHRRMAITGDDVSLDQIVPVSRDFTLEEVSPDGELYILGEWSSWSGSHLGQRVPDFRREKNGVK